MERDYGTLWSSSDPFVASSNLRLRFSPQPCHPPPGDRPATILPDAIYFLATPFRAVLRFGRFSASGVANAERYASLRTLRRKKPHEQVQIPALRLGAGADLAGPRPGAVQQQRRRGRGLQPAS